jgi:hypothetical protein
MFGLTATQTLFKNGVIYGTIVIVIGNANHLPLPNTPMFFKAMAVKNY